MQLETDVERPPLEEVIAQCCADQPRLSLQLGAAYVVKVEHFEDLVHSGTNCYVHSGYVVIDSKVLLLLTVWL